MFLYVCTLLCAFVLCALAHFGIKNYEYDHSENMLVAKTINFSLFTLLATLISIKYFV